MKLNFFPRWILGEFMPEKNWLTLSKIKAWIHLNGFAQTFASVYSLDELMLVAEAQIQSADLSLPKIALCMMGTDFDF